MNDKETRLTKGTTMQAFHGSPVHFDKFEEVDSVVWDGRSPGHFFSSSRKVAEGYAINPLNNAVGMVKEVTISGKLLEIDAKGVSWRYAFGLNPESIARLNHIGDFTFTMEDFADESKHGAIAKHHADRFHEQVALAYMTQGDAKRAYSGQYDGVIIRNVKDCTDKDHSEIATTIMVWNDAVIRC